MSMYGDPIGAPSVATGAPPPAKPVAGKKNKKAPQEILSDFWDKFHTKTPGKVTSIFPRSLYRTVLPRVPPAGARSSRNAAESYEAAARECRENIARIVRECHRTNEKFTDPDFDIEHDPRSNCLNGLITGGDGNDKARDDDNNDSSAAAGGPPMVGPWEVKNSLDVLAQGELLPGRGRITFNANSLSRVLGTDPRAGYGLQQDGSWADPGSVHRVDWIFESPQFTVGGYSSSDIKQGSDGDCWWLAAVATVANRKDLMERVCVARDEECGVYGFVFQRDGEWISTVVDDNLYLENADFDYYGDVYDSTGKRARRHRKEKQTGSEALYFSHCDDPNETWLPLLEKAFAKIHGDYEAISGGWPGEAVEDMTGGVTSTLESNRVFNKDKLWKELAATDGDYVFALAAMAHGWAGTKSGLAMGHAYSILQAREEVDEDGRRVRLVQIRNPWGQRGWNGLGEWNGPWSDGSAEWTPYWLKKFGHTFGDDGVFWMSFTDMLDNFSCMEYYIHRTRLFDKDWTVVQQWTSVNIAWITGYMQTKFEVEVTQAGLVVIVLTQLDGRFFQGLNGQYIFELHFLLRQIGSPINEHICRVRPAKLWKNRAVSCEVHLEPGKYEVLPKITAERDDSSRPVEEVVRDYADINPQKLRQVGMQYDIAHAKGGVLNEDERLQTQRSEQQKKKEERKRKFKERRKREKAMRAAAEAMAQAADAMAALAVSSSDKPAQTDNAKPDGGSKDEEKKADEVTVSDSQPADSSEKPPETSNAAEGAPPAAIPQHNKQDSTSNASTSTEASGATPPTPPAGTETVEKADASGPQETSNEAPAQDGKDGAAADSDSDSDSDSNVDSDADADGDDDDAPASPWNAVAVIGLRVYARDPNVAITLRAAEAGDTPSLTIDGHPTGATM